MTTSGADAAIHNAIQHMTKFSRFHKRGAVISISIMFKTSLVHLEHPQSAKGSSCGKDFISFQYIFFQACNFTFIVTTRANLFFYYYITV
ncbi:hypothetical protein ACVWYN_001671 [Pedobacter sp. UYP24]